MCYVVTFEGERVFHKDKEAFKLNQFYINSTDTSTILYPLMNQVLIPGSFSFDVPLIAPVAASPTLY